MTAEEARKLAKEHIDTKALQRLIDTIDECIKEACNSGNFSTYARLRYGECTFVGAVRSHYSSLGYTITKDRHSTSTYNYTDIEISWE